MVVVNIAHHVLTDQIKIIKTQSPVATWHQWQKGLFLSLNKCTKVFNCFNWPRSYFRRFSPDFTKNVFVTFLPMELTGHYQTMLLVQPTHVTMRFGSTLEAGLRSSPLIPGEFKITQRCLNRDACWLKSVHDDMNGNMYLAVTFIHSQTAAYTVHFIAVASTATPFASPSSSLSNLCIEKQNKNVKKKRTESNRVLRIENVIESRIWRIVTTLLISLIRLLKLVWSMAENFDTELRSWFFNC